MATVRVPASGNQYVQIDYTLARSGNNYNLTINGIYIKGCNYACYPGPTANNNSSYGYVAIVDNNAQTSDRYSLRCNHYISNIGNNYNGAGATHICDSATSAVRSYAGSNVSTITTSFSGACKSDGSITITFKVNIYAYNINYASYSMSGSATASLAAETYTISYNANGHGTAPSAQTKTKGTNLALRSFISNVTDAAVSGTITGNANGGSWSGSNGSAQWATTHQQTYWNTNSSGTGTNYGSGATYSTNAGATLYAIWSSSTAGTSYSLPTGTPTKASSTTTIGTVTVNANGGTLSGYTNNQSSTRTTTYSFKGWFTATSGGTQRTSSSRVTAAETVYAQYDSSTSAQTSVILPTAAQCTKSGAILSGFSTSASDLYPLYDPGSAFTPTANITLYAIWIVVEVIASTYNGKPSGFLTVKGSSNYQKYLPYIRVGSSWQIAIPYVYYNGHWVIAGQTGEIIT